MTTVTRQHLLERLEAVRALWLGLPIERTDEIFADAVHLSTSYHGETQGRAAVLDALRSTFTGLELDYLSVNNRVARTQGRAGVASAYFHGQGTNPAALDQQVLFGGLLVVSLDLDGERSSIADIKVQLVWTEGASALLDGWRLPAADRQWQPGDPPAVIVSELDAVWNRFPQSDLILSDDDAIAEAWFRYAWALDQADFALFEGAFHEDAEAELTPMGHMHGRRLLMGTLKAFRMPWPWMQHHGAPINIEIAADRRSAKLILGRIIPGQTETPDGEPLFGAHYQIEAVKSDDLGWRIKTMDYLPGWITASPE
ncbi:nuclear transport factor 2 family protein [Shinella daejeonensis]|uniref:nuclear transport factor 2 family protein n=1 Tax=Shinella daejeonensis TaxID=659017 RepID=UPI0020C7C6DD|nr:nuclear transport factor 2 family protein [Shinella daejeonensis]MCP8896952.1 nuclear transport factor 2 family protein [Shinella daejeonensis]